MGRTKYILVSVVLLLGLLVGSITCAIISTGNNNSNTSGQPLFSDWSPAYVDELPGTPMDTETLVSNVAPTVVSIITEKVTRDRFFRPIPETGAGSGVIVDPRGLVVTNSHVVEDAEKLTVILSDGRSFDAKQWVNDSATDLAVVLIEPEEELPIGSRRTSPALPCQTVPGNEARTGSEARWRFHCYNWPKGKPP